MDNQYLPAAETLCRQAGIPCPVAEFKFHPKRKWRFDLAWVAYHIAIEINGGVFSGGRHVRGRGYIRDMEKRNASQILNWRVLEFTPEQFLSGDWCEDVKFMIGMTEED